MPLARPLSGSAPGAERIARSRGRGGHGGARATVAGVSISHPDRLVFPALRVTKEGLARFYEAIAPWIVPHLEGRPLTLVRCPDGAEAPCAYMRHAKVWGPAALRRVTIRERTKVGEYLVADTPAAVVALVQMGIVEMHTWNARADDLEHPDRFVIDLDPGETVPWARVVEAANEVRARLAELDLASFVKTTGGKGLHVVVPLNRRAGWDDVLAFTRALCTDMARRDPDAYVASVSKSIRRGKILLDYLRNARANTAVAAYSVRAKAHAPVSTPLTWRELAKLESPDAFTIMTIPPRLGRQARRDRDPWAGYDETAGKQGIRSAMTRDLV